MDPSNNLENSVENGSMPPRKRQRMTKARNGAIQDTSQSTSDNNRNTLVSAPLAEWTPDSLVNMSPKFKHVPRISASLSPKELVERVLYHEESGIPLIIEGIHEQPNWDPKLFSTDGFIGDDNEEVDIRNIETSMDMKMSVRELVNHYLTILKNGKPNDNKLYGKDIRYPQSWESWLRNSLPEHFHPYSRTSDLTSCLNEKSRPESLMCYIGIGDTFTPAHKDLCGSFGHNLMCHTTEGGSAFWFMSTSGPLNADLPSEYFRTELSEELDRESHVATLKEFARAPFDVYIAEQCLGDFVLVPPRSCHQVVNRGGITIKMSWSRMGIKSIEYSLRSELPRYHRICRRETYRVKHTLYAAVKNYCRQLIALQEVGESAVDERKGVENTLCRLLPLLDEVLTEEWSPEHDSFTHIVADEDPQDFHYCDFCGADIFQSFFSCTSCSESGPASEYICCPACCIEGRSCPCGLAVMKPSQTWQFDHLIRERNKAADILNSQGHREIPHISYDALNTSEHLQVFKAACLLQKRKQAWSGSEEPIRNCSPKKAGERTHETLVSSSIVCRLCHACKCYLHILELLNVHVAEAILVDVQSDVAWHTRHTHETRRNVDSGSFVGLLTKMALTYTVCAPMDPKRYKAGFYDKHVLLPPETVTVMPQADHVESDSAMNVDEQIQNGDSPSYGETPYKTDANQATSSVQKEFTSNLAAVNEINLTPVRDTYGSLDVAPDSPLTFPPRGGEDDQGYIPSSKYCRTPATPLKVTPSGKKLEVVIPPFKRKRAVLNDLNDCISIAKRVRINEQPKLESPTTSPTPMSNQDIELIRRKRVSLTVIPTGSPTNRNPIQRDKTLDQIIRPGSNVTRTDYPAHSPSSSAKPLKSILKSPPRTFYASPVTRSRSKVSDLPATATVRDGLSSRRSDRRISRPEGIGSDTAVEYRMLREEDELQKRSQRLNTLLEQIQEKQKMLEDMDQKVKHVSENMRQEGQKHDEGLKRKHQELKDAWGLLEASLDALKKHVVFSNELETHRRTMSRIVELLERQYQESSGATEENSLNRGVEYSWSDNPRSEATSYSNYSDTKLSSKNNSVDPIQSSILDTNICGFRPREDYTTYDETTDSIERCTSFNNDQILKRHTTGVTTGCHIGAPRQQIHPRELGRSNPQTLSIWQEKQHPQGERDGSAHESHHKLHAQYRKDPNLRLHKRRHSWSGPMKSYSNYDEHHLESVAKESGRNEENAYVPWSLDSGPITGDGALGA